MSSWTAASSDCSRPVNNYVHVKTADLYRPNARLTPERQGYQVLTPFGKLGHSRKVERSHRTDQQEFYQLLSYKGDVDLEQRLAEWERFYDFDRPHGAFAGQTPYEALRERLQS